MKAIEQNHGGNWRVKTFAAAALVGVALAAYAGAFGYPLVFDDGVAQLQTLEALRFAPRWLSYGSFALTSAIAGFDVPLLRVQNVLLHAATVVALFYLCRELLGEVRRAAWAAAVAAGGFALNPVTVYGVAYLAQRAIVMATLFSVLCLYAWLRGRLEGDGRWMAAAVALYALAVLSKEHAVMLPAVAVAASMAVRHRVAGNDRQLFGALAAMALVALWALWSMRAVVGEVYEPHLGQAMAAAPAADSHLYVRSIATQAGLFFRYVFTWLVPLPQIMSVDVRVDLVSSLPEALVGVLAFAAFGFTGLGLLVHPRGRPLIGLAMLAPWLFFFTEFAAVRAQEPFVLYRSYLWGIGFAVFMAATLPRTRPRVFVAMALATCIGFGYGMRERLTTFATPIALWDDAVKKLGDETPFLADRPIGNRGTALLQAGRIDEARRDLDRAIELNPRNAAALASRGSMYLAAGALRRALPDFAASIEAQPRNPDVYAARCGLRVALRDLEGARADCAEALAQSPRHALARLNRGVIFAHDGRNDAAEREFAAVLEREPDNTLARMNRAVVLSRLGRTAESAAELQLACRGGVQQACGIRG